MRAHARTAFVILVASMLLAGLAAAGDTEEVTLEGNVMCAKCALHEEGRTECQNVLVVEDDGDDAHYYLAATEANEELGEVCMATPRVRVTGTVEDKDGHIWLMATKIEPVEDDNS